DGKPPGDGELAVGTLVKVPLAIDADDATYDVTWLTSCGTMHDFDLPRAYLEGGDGRDLQVTRALIACILTACELGGSWSLRWCVHAAGRTSRYPWCRRTWRPSSACRCSRSYTQPGS